MLDTTRASVRGVAPSPATTVVSSVSIRNTPLVVSPR